jgi:ABC-2 type transport system permease protein
MVMAAYILIVVPRIFGLLHIAQFRLLIAFIVPFLLATVFFGMMISCVVRYRENVILLVVFTSVPFLFLSGISWPQSNIPSSWGAIAWLFPSTFGIRGYVRLNSMGASLPDIKGEYQALWIQTTVYFFATCLVYRAQLINTRRHAIERINMMKQKLNDRKAKNLNKANKPETAE